MTDDCNKNSASFRDQSGFVFEHGDKIYRQINHSYKENFEMLISSGLYEKLTTDKLLIPHTDTEHTPPYPETAYKLIQPEHLKFISYPYEWSFSMLKDAALTTLEVQKTALDFGMSLKDASAYNIQFFYTVNRFLSIRYHLKNISRVSHGLHINNSVSIFWHRLH